MEELLDFSAIGLINYLSRDRQNVEFRPEEDVQGA